MIPKRSSLSLQSWPRSIREGLMEKQGTEGGLGVRVAKEEEFFQYKIIEVCTPFINSFIIVIFSHKLLKPNKNIFPRMLSWKLQSAS